MKKNNLAVLLFLLLPFFAQSQNIKYGDIKVTSNFDSLMKLETHQTGIVRLNTLLSLQKSYLFWFQEDTKYLNILDTLIKKDFPSELPFIQAFKAHYSICSFKDYKNAFHSGELSLAEFKKRGDIEGQVNSMTLLGILGHRLNNLQFKQYLNNAYNLSKKSQNIESTISGEFSKCRMLVAGDSIAIEQSAKACNEMLTYINKNKYYTYFAPLFYNILSLIHASKKESSLSVKYETLIIDTYKKNISTIPLAIYSKYLNNVNTEIQRNILMYFLKEKDREKEFLLKEKAFLQREKEILATQNKLYVIIYAITIGGLLGAIAFSFVYKRKNDLLKIANENIIQFNKLRVYFLGIIAHDLRQPLMAFNGINETLKYHITQKNYPIIEKLVSAVEASGKRLQYVLDNLLSWAYSQKEEIPYNPAWFNIYNAIHDTLSIYEYSIDTKNISVKINCDEQLMIFTDQEGMALIFRNLVANAIKSVKQDYGKIVVDIQKINQGKTQIKITDNGHGIEESKFEVINKVLASPNDSQPGENGLGLGILLVSRFVQRYNGKIEVESVPTNGTTFIIVL